MSVSEGEIKAWWHDAVTWEFFQHLRELKDYNDEQVHKLLKPVKGADFQDQMLQSSFYNAAVNIIDEVADIPNQMILEKQETLTEE